MRFFILILFLTVSLLCEAQTFLKEVDHSRLVNKEVEKYLKKQSDNNILKFTDVEPSLNPGEETSGYHIQILEYNLRGSGEQIWNHYLSTPARKIWDCGRITLNLLFSGKDESLFYHDNAEEYLEPNQLVFLTLNFLNGLVRLPMSFIITSIDKENNIIEFSYITGNTAHGKQQLVFHETNKGHAWIEHISYFKSNSFVRDRILYPYFHKKVTDSFHRNMWRKMVEHQD